MKLFEYMAAGKAVVAADVPSLREVLTKETAQFFTSGDAASLAAAISGLAEEERRKQLGGAVQQAAQQYTWNQRGAVIAAHLQSLVT
jgi:Glycosyltransferase